MLLDIIVTLELCWNYYEIVLEICRFSGVEML